MHYASRQLSKQYSGLRVWLSKANKWRLSLLVFIFVYALFLLFNLGFATVQWDEMPHLYGGLLLSRGNAHEYLMAYGYFTPLPDVVTAGYFQLLGINVVSGRLVSVMFSILSVWILFELANKAYGPKNGLFSSVILATMPGFFVLSRTAMLEPAVIFFFALVMLLFFGWVRKGQDKALILCSLALAVGFLAKYTVLVAGLVIIAGIFVTERNSLRWRLSKVVFVLVLVFLFVLPWLVFINTTGNLGDFGKLLYVARGVDADRAVYSVRFPTPVFYLIEMTVPFNGVPINPVSVPIYLLGLLGLVLFAWRRKTEDKLFLTWFAVVYVFFTILPSREWRYVVHLFPVLAISAACFVSFVYGKLAEAGKKAQNSLSRVRLLKVASLFLVVFFVASFAYSSYNAYQMVVLDQIHVPVEEATNYAVENLQQNESLMVLAPINYFDKDMVLFYLQAKEPVPNRVLQYPEVPFDSSGFAFNVSTVIAQCTEQCVKYLFLYENGGDVPYYLQSNMTAMQIYQDLTDSGMFVVEHRVGNFPRTITIFSFVQ